MKSLWKNFKKLIMRGNIVDLAIGVMVGGAFGKITTSLANDIIMPPISYLLKGVHFTDLKYVIAEATETTKEVAINYGNFIQVIVDFLIIAFSVCLFATIINKLRDAANENIESGRAHMKKLRHRLRNAEERAAFEAAEAEAQAAAAAAEAEAAAKEEAAKAEAKAREQLMLDAQRTQMEQTALLKELVALLQAKN